MAQSCPRCQTGIAENAAYCSSCGAAVATSAPGGSASAEELEHLQRALAGRYRVEARLGQGGMATVYSAVDERHDRRVAVKVMKPSLAVLLGGSRFLREVQLAARLQHPHILPVHDSGDAAGMLYYITPLVEGGSLRDHLDREGTLPVEEAVRLIRQVADALGYAHAHGVIHRDIKPDNVLLSGGHALVADFGIARGVSQATDGSRITETGFSVGTPGYMAPEQAIGSREVDHRSDIYALGVMAFELLTGRLPYAGPDAAAILKAQLTEPAPALDSVRPGLPPTLTGAVAKCLERDPGARWSDMPAFLSALEPGSTAPGHPLEPAGWFALSGRRLRAVTAAAAIVLLTIAGLAYWPVRSSRNASGLTPSERPLTTTGRVAQVALSPDGRYLAYAEHDDSGGGRLLVQDIGNGLTVERPSVGRPYRVQWNWEGTELFFRDEADSARSLYRVPFVGGEVRRVHGIRHHSLTGPSGQWLGRSSGSTVLVVDSTGSDSTFLATAPDSAQVIFLAWSQGGDRVAYFTWKPRRFALLVMAVSGGEPRVVYRDSLPISGLAWGPQDRRVYFLRKGPTLPELVAIDLTERNPEPRVVMSNWSAAETGGGLSWSISRDGRRLAFVELTSRASIYHLRRQDTTLVSTGTITSGTSAIAVPELSPDGATIAALEYAADLVTVTLLSREGIVRRRLGQHTSWAGLVYWSPKGDSLGYCSLSGASRLSFVASATESGARALTPSDRCTRAGWHPAGGLLVRDSASAGLKWERPGQPSVQLFSGSGWVGRVVGSPDGNWLALERTSRTAADSAGVWLVSSDGTRTRRLHPIGYPSRFDADSRTLYVVEWEDAPVSPSRPPRVVAFPVPDGKPATWAVAPYWCGPLSVLPEEDVAYCSRDESDLDAFLVENFDPDAGR